MTARVRPHQLFVAHHLEPGTRRFIGFSGKLTHPNNNIGHSRPKKYFLTVGAIFHSEYYYLSEWIEFHKKQGFEQFYLYDNEVHPRNRALLQPYIDSGLVKYHEWPDVPKQGNMTQRLAYYDCLKKYASETEWLAFFDLDEFIFPESSLTNLKTTAAILKQNYQQYGQVSVIRYNYGNNWHSNKPAVGGVTLNYLTRDKTFSNVKSFINTRYYNGTGPPRSVHIYHELIKNGQTIDGQVTPCLLRFNHYLTKSTEEFTNRNNMWKIKQQSTKFNPPDLLRFNNKIHPESLNHVYDDAILPFLGGAPPPPLTPLP